MGKRISRWFSLQEGFSRPRRYDTSHNSRNTHDCVHRSRLTRLPCPPSDALMPTDWYRHLAGRCVETSSSTVHLHPDAFRSAPSFKATYSGRWNTTRASRRIYPRRKPHALQVISEDMPCGFPKVIATSSCGTQLSNGGSGSRESYRSLLTDSSCQ